MMTTEELLVYARNLFLNSAWDPGGTQLNELYATIIQSGKVKVVNDAMSNYVEPEWDHWQ